MNCVVRMADADQLHLARSIAQITWPVAYSHILQPGQLEYMLDKFYCDAALYEQYHQQQHQFLYAYDDDTNVIGFASYSRIAIDENKTTCKLHKLYVLPDWQKTGIGKILLEEVITASKNMGATHLIVNVNRQNNAIHFYQKMEFELVKEEDIDIGNGYYMIDYVLERKL